MSASARQTSACVSTAGPLTYLALLGATVGWGAGSTMTRLAVAELPPLTLTCLRFGSGALLLLLALALRGEARSLPDRRAFPALVVLGLLGVTLFGALMTVGLQWTGAAEGTLIQGLSPFFTLVFAAVLAGEKARRWQIIGGLTAFCGLAALLFTELARWSEGGEGLRLLGNVTLVGSSLCWAAYNVSVRLTAGRVNLGESSAYALLIGTALLIPFALLEPTRTPLPEIGMWTMIAVLYLTVVSTCLAYIWWNDGIRKIGAGRTAMFSFVAPVAAMVSAIPLLGEWPGEPQLIGGALILTGLYLANRR